MESYELNTYSLTRHNLTVFVGIAVGMSCLGWALVEKQSLGVCMVSFFAILGVAKLLAIKFERAVATFYVDVGAGVQQVDGKGVAEV